ncbi:MAG TPA: hypothetical protein VIQ51_05920 [Chryseosolibacter sp.]|jgi:hypothetical protein
MSEPTKKVAILELRRLLVELKEHRPDICIRLRLIGQMWSQKFLRVIRLTEQGGVLLNDENLREFTSIQNLSHIMQFELDKPFQLYQPFFHYDVVTTGEW